MVGTDRPDWGALEGQISGAVITADSPGYEAARRSAIPRFNHVRPAVVVRCETEEDVAAALGAVRRWRVPFAIRSGGHCLAGRSSTPGAIIDLSHLDSVTIEGDLASVGGGARLGPLYNALAPYGRTIAAGCGHSVGVAGLALGGGIGIMGRRHGLTCDQLLSARVVLADGSTVVCDEHHDEELFWALRGAGGGQFGIVTRLDLRTVSAPRTTCFHLIWPQSQAASLIGRWQRWAPMAPEEMAASLLVTASDEPRWPVDVHLFGTVLTGRSDTLEQLDQFLQSGGGAPISTVVVELPFREAKQYVADHGPGNAPPDGHGYIKSEFFAHPLPGDAIAGLVDHLTTDRAVGESRELDFTAWGGAYARTAPAATAFAHRSARFLLKHTVTVSSGAARERQRSAREWLVRSWDKVHRWGSGGVYPNFPDPLLRGWQQAYHGSNYERLTRVKAQYDPDELLRFPQSLPAGRG